MPAPLPAGLATLLELRCAGWRYNTAHNALFIYRLYIYIYMFEHEKTQFGRVRKRGVTRQNSRGGPLCRHKSPEDADLVKPAE